MNINVVYPTASVKPSDGSLKPDASEGTVVVTDLAGNTYTATYEADSLTVTGGNPPIVTMPEALEYRLCEPGEVCFVGGQHGDHQRGPRKRQPSPPRGAGRRVRFRRLLLHHAHFGRSLTRIPYPSQSQNKVAQPPNERDQNCHKDAK